MNTQKQLSEKLAVMHRKHSLSLVQPVESKIRLRDEIESHVERFLAAGGKISVHEIQRSHVKAQPPRGFTIKSGPNGYIGNNDAANYVGVPRSTLSQLCAKGTGPEHRKLPSGASVFLIEALDAWKTSRQESGTWTW